MNLKDKLPKPLSLLFFTRGGRVLIAIILIIACGASFVFWDYDEKHEAGDMIGRLKHLGHFAVEHAGIEIASALFMWFLLDLAIKEYRAIPNREGKRNYNKILDEIISSQHLTKVSIIDNNMSPFYENVPNLRIKIESILQELPPISDIENPPFRILLLHPNTNAAKQRHLDLYQNPEIRRESPDLYNDGLFKRMKAGLKYLHDTISNLPEDAKSKIEVKLFQTSHSLTFIAWDDNMNFGIMSPNASTDSETFNMKTSHLSKYFLQNFNKIWRDEKSVTIDDYKYIAISFEDNEFRAYWGADSHNDELPIFFAFNINKKDTEFLSKLNLIDKHSNLLYTKKSSIVKIFHNGTYQLATVELMSSSPNPDENHLSLKDFAKGQIRDNYNMDLGGLECIFKINYKYDSRRINLIEENYVSKYLNSAGYCYVPHTKYDVSLGLHINNMLNNIYNFFIKDFIVFYPEFAIGAEHEKMQYTRSVMLQYKGTINRDYKINADFINEGNELRDKGLEAMFPHYGDLIYNGISDNSKKNLINFLKSTIESDLYHISGHKHPIEDQFNAKTVIYDVRVHLIQSRVNKELGHNYISTQIIDKNDDEYVENTANTTVIHMAGRKNVYGGINELTITKTHAISKKETESIITFEKYNLKSTLDTIYYNQVFNKVGTNAVSLEYATTVVGSSSAIQFNRYSIDDIENTEYGYRNIIAIEFFKKTV